jgi:hypothetical protein
MFEDIKMAQKVLLKNPLFFSLAHLEIYWPSATQRIDAPNPFTAADR